ncbi:MAG: hypothetical protein HC884_17745, partial [Chloroflexaceae bacterium]|nr:hypothetical protein [Chloroflexaceae bacterium]
RVRASLREQGQAAGPLSADGHRRERLHLADRLTFDAWERGVSREEQALLADLAIALAPDHADSYAIHGWLAEQRGDLPAAQRWYAQGVAAGERFLGAASFAQAIRGERRFWGWVETRPYMRARASLALVLWKQGLLHEAIPHYQALLDLNFRDNQGNRYLLASLLLEAGDDEAFERLPQQWWRLNAGADEGDDCPLPTGADLDEALEGEMAESR